MHGGASSGYPYRLFVVCYFFYFFLACVYIDTVVCIWRRQVELCVVSTSLSVNMQFVITIFLYSSLILVRRSVRLSVSARARVGVRARACVCVYYICICGAVPVAFILVEFYPSALVLISVPCLLRHCNLPPAPRPSLPVSPWLPAIKRVNLFALNIPCLLPPPCIQPRTHTFQPGVRRMSCFSVLCSMTKSCVAT